MNKQKRSIGILLLFFLILSTCLLHYGEVYSNGNNSLVLVETQKGKWTAYSDMSCNSSEGYAMIKVSEFCDAIGFDYSSSNSTKQFSILKNESIKNVYLLGSKNFYYYSANGRKMLNTVKGAAYYDKSMKTNLCDAISLSSICNMKSFNVSGTDYADLNYSNVLCYSKFSAVVKLPDITKITYEDGKSLYDPGLSYKSPDGKWRTKMFYIDSIMNGKRNLFSISTGSRLKVRYLVVNASHNINFNSELFSVDIEIGESAIQGITYTRENIGEATVEPRIISWPGYARPGTKLEGNSIKEVTARLDILDRSEGTVVGYIKIVGEDDNKNKFSFEGYFADNLLTHSLDADYQQFLKVKNLKASMNNNTSNSNSPNNSVNSGNSNMKLNYVTCSNCNGKGKIKCSSCDGVGYREHMGYRYGVYGKIVDTCLACGGAGARSCSVCGGSGSVPRITK